MASVVEVFSRILPATSIVFSKTALCLIGTTL